MQFTLVWHNRNDIDLHVVDPVMLRAALVGGIGPAKGYGCGLLTLSVVFSGRAAQSTPAAMMAPVQMACGMLLILH